MALPLMEAQNERSCCRCRIFNPDIPGMTLKKGQVSGEVPGIEHTNFPSQPLILLIYNMIKILAYKLKGLM